MVRAICPNCEQTVSFADHLAGFRVKCPECRGMMDVPEATERDPGPESVVEQHHQSRSRLLHEDDRPASVPEEESGSAPARNSRQPPSPWPGRMKWLATLGGIPAGLALLAWWLEGNSAWEVCAGIGALLLALFSVGFLKEWLTSLRREGLRPMALLLLVYCWGSLGVFYLVGNLSMTGIVHVDNYSDSAVTIELDGAPWIVVPNGRHQEHRMHYGSHRLTVRAVAGGNPLQELTVSVEGRKVYLFNVLQAQTYYRGSVHYGGLSLFGSGDAEPDPIKDAWQDVTRVDFLFQAPPRSITVKVPKGMPAGLSSETRTYLTRGSPPPLDR